MKRRVALATFFTSRNCPRAAPFGWCAAQWVEGLAPGKALPNGW
ncbi:hypothetical protein ACFWD7_57990 [Streptomyces mirabilis]